MFGAPLRIIISHGTQTKVDVRQSSTNMDVQMATDDKDHLQHSHPYPVLLNNEDETGKRGPCDPSALSGTVNEASEGEMPRRQGVLSGAIDEADVKDGKIVYLIAIETTESREGLWMIRWFDQDHADLLQEIDFFRTIILFKKCKVHGTWLKHE